ncbi:MAG: TetR/AcrR family transcriptional regulator [Lachnospiraceae bacterium]|nr:TetR/AcrR family transcriptional regulator [Lachnospiraceae bacterium]
MPTERFYHLPQEKKNLIREAAIEEFSRTSVEKASINKIVQRAEISRGSFYTYFADKEDVLYYIFDDLILQVQNFCKEALLKNRGNFWILMERLMDYIIDIYEGRKSLVENQSAAGHEVMAKILSERCGQVGEDDREKSSWQGQLYQMTDCSHLKVENFEEFRILFALCINCMMPIIGESCRAGIQREESRSTFQKQLCYIKFGAVKS